MGGTHKEIESSFKNAKLKQDNMIQPLFITNMNGEDRFYTKDPLKNGPIYGNRFIFNKHFSPQSNIKGQRFDGNIFQNWHQINTTKRGLADIEKYFLNKILSLFL